MFNTIRKSFSFQQIKLTENENETTDDNKRRAKILNYVSIYHVVIVHCNRYTRTRTHTHSRRVHCVQYMRNIVCSIMCAAYCSLVCYTNFEMKIRRINERVGERKKCTRRCKLHAQSRCLYALVIVVVDAFVIAVEGMRWIRKHRGRERKRVKFSLLGLLHTMKASEGKLFVTIVMVCLHSTKGVQTIFMEHWIL